MKCKCFTVYSIWKLAHSRWWLSVSAGSSLSLRGFLFHAWLTFVFLSWMKSALQICKLPCWRIHGVYKPRLALWILCCQVEHVREESMFQNLQLLCRNISIRSIVVHRSSSQAHWFCWRWALRASLSALHLSVTAYMSVDRHGWKPCQLDQMLRLMLKKEGRIPQTNVCKRCRSVGFRLLTEVLAALLMLPLDHSSFVVCPFFLPFVFMFPANGFSRDSLCNLFWSG